MQMKQMSIYLIILLLFVIKGNVSGTDIFHIHHPSSDFESRKNMIIDSLADWASKFTLEDFKASDDFEGGKYGAYPIMALYERGHIEKAREFTAQQLVGGAAMFREFSTMALYMEYHHLYGEELREKVKQDQLKSNFFNLEAEVEEKEVSQSHRNERLEGASENHKLMYAAAAYLAGIAWPDEYPKEWFNIGYNHLMRWFDTVTSIGFWEEDSPTYLIHHMGPIVSVADHAPEGSEMKTKATMVLDWYFASVAGEYLHGYWITPAARDYNPLYGLAFSAETTSLTWLYFGDVAQIPNPHVYQPWRHWKAVTHFAVSDYRLPDIIKRIATDRDQPYVHKEFMAKNPMRPKEYCYINSKYGMSSILSEEGRIVPDMTRWKVQWVASKPDGEPSTFFMKHPYEENDWKSWRGASPAEQVLQHENALIAVYKIDEGKKEYIEGPYREEVFEAVMEEKGWRFMHTGSNLIAVKAINGLELTGEERSLDHHPEIQVELLKSYGLRNGLIIQTAPLEDYKNINAEESLKLFMNDVLSNTEIDSSDINRDYPELSFKSLSGNQLAIKFDHYKKVNDEQLNFTNWPLLGNPWMHQKYKGDGLILKHAGEKRIYDFQNWKIIQD